MEFGTSTSVFSYCQVRKVHHVRHGTRAIVLKSAARSHARCAVLRGTGVRGPGAVWLPLAAVTRVLHPVAAQYAAREPQAWVSPARLRCGSNDHALMLMTCALAAGPVPHAVQLSRHGGKPTTTTPSRGHPYLLTYKRRPLVAACSRGSPFSWLQSWFGSRLFRSRPVTRPWCPTALMGSVSSYGTPCMVV